MEKETNIKVVYNEDKESMSLEFDDNLNVLERAGMILLLKQLLNEDY